MKPNTEISNKTQRSLAIAQKPLNFKVTTRKKRYSPSGVLTLTHRSNRPDKATIDNKVTTVRVPAKTIKAKAARV